MQQSRPNGLVTGAAIVASVSLARCAPEQTEPEPAEPEPSIQQIKADGELTVLTVEGPTSYRLKDDGVVGYETVLAKAFAESLGVEARFVVKDSVGDLLQAIENAEGDIAAGNLTMTRARQENYAFGPSYKNIREQVVCGADVPAPEAPVDLVDRSITVVEGSSYAESLAEMQADVPEIIWSEEAAGSAMPLLTAVEAGEVDCTVSDSHLVEFARRRHPDLRIAMDITEDRSLGWIYNPEIDGMDAELGSWFATAHENGYLEELDESEFGHFEEFDYVDVAAFIQRLRTRFPKYRDYFIEAADETPFEWELLAAQAYQESHWDPLARSPTGVRGLMMLTLPTAQEVGVENRLDPEESVEGGAVYLERIYDRLPEEITGDDRLWIALAAYNVGLGHIYDARDLARRQGLDPNQWDNLAETLPLLTKPQFYSAVRHGYCRGYEPVRYVKKIREYRGMIEANTQV